MMEEAQKKGLSKGCVVALIIVGALVLIVAIGALTCWFYRADLAKMGVVTVVNQARQSYLEDPPADADTARFNALTGAFVDKLNEEQVGDDDSTLMKIAEMMQMMQVIMNDNQVSAEEADQMAESMIDYYPELEEYYLTQEPADSMAPDSSITE
jgi:flagellar basal body-associated protein FliL